MPGTVEPAEDFDAGSKAEELKDAMDGLGTNEEKIIDVLVHHSNTQRNEIATAYKQAYGKDILDDLESELGGNFEDAIVSLMMPPRLFDVRELNRSIKGAGTDDTALVEIMASRTNEEIEEIKALYKQEYENELEDDLQGDTSGYYERFLVALCAAGRETNEDVEYDKVEEDVQKFIDAGEACLGTEESTMNAVLCLRSFPQLRAIFELYSEKTGRDIETDIENETSGNLQCGFLAVVRMARDEVRFFAKRLNDAIAGAGTYDSDLIRIIVSRSEIDLADIRDCYGSEYDKTLAEAISDDCSGDYKRLLLALLY